MNFATGRRWRSASCPALPTWGLAILAGTAVGGFGVSCRHPRRPHQPGASHARLNPGLRSTLASGRGCSQAARRHASLASPVAACPAWSQLGELLQHRGENAGTLLTLHTSPQPDDAQRMFMGHMLRGRGRARASAGRAQVRRQLSWGSARAAPRDARRAILGAGRRATAPSQNMRARARARCWRWPKRWHSGARPRAEIAYFGTGMRRARCRREAGGAPPLKLTVKRIRDETGSCALVGAWCGLATARRRLFRARCDAGRAGCERRHGGGAYGSERRRGPEATGGSAGAGGVGGALERRTPAWSAFVRCRAGTWWSSSPWTRLGWLTVKRTRS